MSDVEAMGDTIDHSDERERVRQLMIGFASGRLDKPDMRELLGLLQDPAHGAAHAHEAWDVLDTAAGLRAVAPEMFLDQVVLRLGSSGVAIASAVAARIGRSRPRLKPVKPPPPVKSYIGRWIVGIAIVIAVAALSVWWWLRPAAVAQVIAVEGVITAGQIGLIPGTDLPAGPLIVPRGARVQLRSSSGDRIELNGPSQVQVAPKQWSLSLGRMQVRANSNLLVGMPSVSVRLAATDAVELLVTADAATIYVLHGAPLATPAIGAPRILAATATSSWQIRP